jgi:hypothetical protein
VGGKKHPGGCASGTAATPDSRHVGALLGKASDDEIDVTHSAAYRAPSGLHFQRQD